MTAWSERVLWGGIPERMKGGVTRYIERGVLPGHFLEAVFSNDFMEAFKRADEENGWIMREYARFLYNYCPAGSFGSPAKFKAWLKHSGLEGLKE